MALYSNEAALFSRDKHSLAPHFLQPDFQGVNPNELTDLKLFLDFLSG
jgi:hypothetical protein